MDRRLLFSRNRPSQEVIEVLKTLLEAHRQQRNPDGDHQGHALNQRTISAGVTPLHFAVQNRETSVVRWLLENGSEQSILDGWGSSPLALAARHNAQTRNIILALLQADGSQELLLLRSNQTRRTPLEEAVVSGNIAATETLLRAMPPREFTNLTRQALLRLTRTFRPMHDHTGRALRRILHDHFRELDREGKTPDTAKETAKARTTDAATLTISCKLDQDKNASNARSR